jgi:hypothetical protein
VASVPDSSARDLCLWGPNLKRWRTMEQQRHACQGKAKWSLTDRNSRLLHGNFILFGNGVYQELGFFPLMTFASLPQYPWKMQFESIIRLRKSVGSTSRAAGFYKPR